MDTMTTEEIKTLLADAAVALVEAKARDKALAVDASPFAAFDNYAAEIAAQSRPLIIASIEDDTAELAELQAMTENLVGTAEFVMAVLDRVLQYAGPFLALL